MNWADEPYVKFYRRVTADMLAWNWQARALWPWLLIRADNAGLVDTGRRDPVGAVSLLTNLPREVVEPGLADLLADGCLEQVDGGYLIRNFVEAQEATKTPRAKKRDQRERERDKRRSAQRREILTPPVTGRHQVSPVVTDCPPPTPTPTPEEACAGQPAAEPAPDAPDEPPLKAVWNETTTPPLPRWERTPKSRRILATNGAKRRPVDGPTGWREVFRRIEASPFCRGENDRGWLADVDWALRPDGKKPETAQRVLEGAFDARATGPPNRAARGRASEADKDWTHYEPNAKAF